MNKEEFDFLKKLINEARSADNGYFEYCSIVARRLPKNIHESLQQLIDNPVWDGNVISKSLRDDLIDLDLAVRVCANGEQGYTAARYIAHTVMKYINDIKSGKPV